MTILHPAVTASRLKFIDQASARYTDQGNSQSASDRHRRSQRQRRCRVNIFYPRTTQFVLAFAAFCLLFCGGLAQAVNCCFGPDAQVDCMEAGVEYQGERYYCMSLESAQMRACVSCIPAITSNMKCSSCCGTPNAECDLEWSWGAVLATLSVSAVFATCSGILALAEKRRKRKGMSLARAWSIPHGMPVLRATVVDLSDAVRGRASIWSVDGLSGEDVCDEELLENVGLLEELPNDSIYGALVEQREADIPVAKLAEDDWVTAMAFASGNPNPGIDPVTYGSGSSSSSRGGHDSRAGGEEPWSVSRWRSARSTARQARRLNSSVGSSSSRGGGAVPVPARASTAYENASASPNPCRSGAAGAGGSGWERPPPVVVSGNDSERSSEEEEEGSR